MADAIQHRGPDDEGYLLLNTDSGAHALCGGADTATDLCLPPLETATDQPYDLGLASRRLAILDLSAAGHMPMSSEDGSCWIIHNGEVYNYLELRQELTRRGHTFRTETDTEVILAAYDEWGEECLSHFNGMWAFALWDSQRQQFFCARDRLGIKPFYYAYQNGTFYFASEIKALVAGGQVPVAPNERAIYNYLAWLDLDYDAETFFDGIYQLPPSHYLIVRPGQPPAVHRWWDVVPNHGLQAELGPNEAARQTFSLLADAVRLRLRSDVPVGTCLSGGLDSSSIVVLVNHALQDGALAPDLIGERQKTFTSCFEDPRFDEREYAELVLAHTGAERNFVFPNSEGLLAELFDLIWHQDAPINSSNTYAQWCVMRCAAERGVKVLLDGQTGDEVLAGYYNTYCPTYAAQLFRAGHWLLAWRELRRGAAITGYPWRDLIGRSFYYGLVPAALQRRLRLRRDNWALAWLNPDFAWRFEGAPWPGQATLETRTLVGRLYHDTFQFILPQLLRYEDRNSMAFSIEARLPFSDYRFLEFIFAQPAGYKIRDGWTKWLLRQAMQEHLPAEVCWRRDKKGFVTPEVIWLQEGVSWLRSLFDGNQALSAPYLKVAQIKQRLPQLLAQEPWVGHSHVWRLVNLEVWLRRFMGGQTRWESEQST